MSLNTETKKVVESAREEAHAERYEHRKQPIRFIHKTRSPPSLSHQTQQQGRCEPHGPGRWVEPPRSTTSSHSNIPGLQIHLGSFWVFRGLIFDRLSRGGYKHAWNVMWVKVRHSP